MYLPHRIRIEQNTPSQDTADTGVVTDEWTHFASPWAHFKSASAREFIAAGIEVSKIVASVRVRTADAAGVTRAMRVQFGGRTYNIEAILPDPESGNDYVILPVSEVSND